MSPYSITYVYSSQALPYTYMWGRTAWWWWTLKRDQHPPSHNIYKELLVFPPSHIVARTYTGEHENEVQLLLFTFHCCSLYIHTHVHVHVGSTLPFYRTLLPQNNSLFIERVTCVCVYIQVRMTYILEESVVSWLQSVHVTVEGFSMCGHF